MGKNIVGQMAEVEVPFIGLERRGGDTDGLQSGD
jgi:hypothetical protein